MEVEMYIQINDEIYDSNKKKIIFALSYMKEETATPWKQNFWMTEKLDDRITPWTWKRFKDTLKASFAPPDRPGEALATFFCSGKGFFFFSFSLLLPLGAGLGGLLLVTSRAL